MAPIRRVIAASLGKIPTTPVALDLAVEAFERVGGVDLRPMIPHLSVSSPMIGVTARGYGKLSSC
jgi:hypothetical protein